MFALKRESIECHQSWIALESFVSEIGSSFFKKTLAASYQAFKADEAEVQPALFLESTTSNEHVGLAFNTKRGWLTSGVAIVGLSKDCSDTLSQHYQISSKSPSLEEMLRRDFILREKNQGSFEATVAVWIPANGENSFVNNQKILSTESVEAFDLIVPINSAQSELDKQEFPLLAYLDSRRSGKRVKVQGINQEKIYLQIVEGEISMEKLNQSAQFTLNLGCLELSSKDAAQLRPGMTIEFDKPQVFHASLELAGNVWAQVLVQLQEDRLSMQVLEVIK